MTNINLMIDEYSSNDSIISSIDSLRNHLVSLIEELDRLKSRVSAIETIAFQPQPANDISLKDSVSSEKEVRYKILSSLPAKSIKAIATQYDITYSNKEEVIDSILVHEFQ